MTTSRSPIRVLKNQADSMAKMLKAVERREFPTVPHAAKIIAARDKPGLKFAVMMDDKLISIEMTWAKIHDTSEAALSAFILKYMRNQRDQS